MLALEIELLTGVYRAALPDNSRAEWPPHPERVFSALVQAWGDGGCDPAERAALEWLESLPSPFLKADLPEHCGWRSASIVYVPPNDSRGDNLAVLPDRRLRQARNFHVAVPADPLVTLIWPESADEERHRAALASLAHRVASLGHSASLARFTFTSAERDESAHWRPDPDGSLALRVPHSGRLRRLEDWFSKNQRPRSGMAIRYLELGSAPPPQPRKSVFGGAGDWFVFEDAGGVRPDLLAFAHVARCVRASLMKHGPQPSPEIISGHTPSGKPASTPHLAIVPLASVGWSHASGDLLGFAVVLPLGITAADRDHVLRALGGFAPINEDGEAYAELRLSSSVRWRVERTAAPSRASLKPMRWCRAETAWASATPVVLDRYPDHGDPVEEARLIAAACRNVGLPEPTEIQIHKHSAVRGAPSAYKPSASRSALDWSFPEGAKFITRPRRHLVLRFDQLVEGPIILGAGRYHGLGLCLPMAEEREP